MQDDSTKMRMPKMMYGTAWKKERTTALVSQALKAGFRGIDTACQPKHYREDLVGQAIHEAIESGLVKRDELYIQTKFTSTDGQDMSQPIPYDPHLSPSDQVSQSIKASLTNLRISRIDSVILHGPLRTPGDTLSAYKSLEDHVKQGIIGEIGVSNFYNVEQLQLLWDGANVKPGIVQNRWYEGNEWDREVWGWCQQKGIRYQSFWTLTGSPTLLAFPQFVKMAQKHKVTPQQLLYKLCQLWDITPLCGSTTLKHVEEALQVVEISLMADDEEVKAMRKLVLGV